MKRVIRISLWGVIVLTATLFISFHISSIYLIKKRISKPAETAENIDNVRQQHSQTLVNFTGTLQNAHTSNVSVLNGTEKVRSYYSPRKIRINPVEAKFIIKGSQICSTRVKYMTILILVPSMPSNYLVRDSIRSTYGSYAHKTFYVEDNVHGKEDQRVSVKLAFLVGKDNDIETESMIQKESRTHGDIIYADFIESYRNLTWKMLIALNWVTMYCNNIDFMLKVDEDVFVNIPKLVKELRARPYDKQGSIYGFLYHNSNVNRKGSMGITMNEFPLHKYPTYASGNSYVISGNIISRLLMASEYLPYMPKEDAFITGCLARVIRCKQIQIPGFTYGLEPEPDPCRFARNGRISANKVTTNMMRAIWKACTSYEEFCKREFGKNNWRRR